jgi:ABC-type multidrug transport system permease subunit
MNENVIPKSNNNQKERGDSDIVASFFFWILDILFSLYIIDIIYISHEISFETGVICVLFILMNICVFTGIFDILSYIKLWLFLER